MASDDNIAGKGLGGELHEAVWDEDVSRVRSVLEPGDVDVNSEDGEGRTPLYVIVDKERRVGTWPSSNATLIWKVLISHGADLDHICRQTGLTPYQAAILASYDELWRPHAESPSRASPFKGCESVAYHEAGHAVVHVEMRFGCLHSVRIGDGGIGPVSPLPGATTNDGPDIAGCMMYAGPVAQQKYLDTQHGRPMERGAAEELWRKYSHDDIQRIADLAKKQAGKCSHSACTLMRQWREAAEQQVEDHWCSIVAVAAKLLEEGGLCGTEVEELLREVGGS